MNPEPEYTPYQERSQLLGSLLVPLFGGIISYNDPVHPDWPVLYSETPEGQMSWHIAPEDLGVFTGLQVIPTYPWDGHTTAQKYERLYRLGRRIPRLSYANPTYGEP
jgi:hypothetical protein